MSAVTAVAGYPVHAVVSFTRRTNPHGARFTDWRGACGATGTETGHGPFGLAGSARRLELCPACFPGRSWYAVHYADPVEMVEVAQ